MGFFLSGKKKQAEKWRYVVTEWSLKNWKHCHALPHAFKQNKGKQYRHFPFVQPAHFKQTLTVGSKSLSAIKTKTKPFGNKPGETDTVEHTWVCMRTRTHACTHPHARTHEVPALVFLLYYAVSYSRLWKDSEKFRTADLYHLVSWCDLDQELADYSLWARSCLQSVFSKVLLKHSHCAHSFLCSLWLLLHVEGGIEYLLSCTETG